jgi:hypothetical protein
MEHAVKAQLNEMRAASEARAERLEAARARERKSRTGAAGAFRTNKRTKVVGEGSGSGSSVTTKGDEEFLPEDKEDEGDDDGVYLSKEVRDLMAK